MTFEVYATRWDSPGIVAQLIPARGLSFSMPLSAHGEASFSATVEPGKSSWRASLGGVNSGILIAESQDNGPSIPVWAGRLKSESQSGTRGFQFTCEEWGSALSWFPAVADRWDAVHDTDIYVDILTRAQAVGGQNLQIGTQGAVRGKSVSDFEVKPWETMTVDEQLRHIADADGGPEWAYTVTGTLKTPVRQLLLADRLGVVTPRVVLEYVEDTADWAGPTSPQVVLLGDLFPTPGVAVPTRRAGGNVIAASRSQDSEKAATVVVATGAGTDAAQLKMTAVAADLLVRGFPRITRTIAYSDVTNLSTLQRYAQAELAAGRGVLTDYSLVTLGKSPDWRQVTRGSSVRVILDTDVFAGPRPLTLTSRVLNITVSVPDGGGPEQVQWDTGEVLEVV